MFTSCNNCYRCLLIPSSYIIMFCNRQCSSSCMTLSLWAYNQSLSSVCFYVCIETWWNFGHQHVMVFVLGVSVASKMTRVEGNFRLKSSGMCSSIESLEGHKSNSFSWKYKKLIQHIITLETVDSEILNMKLSSMSSLAWRNFLRVKNSWSFGYRERHW